MDGYKSSPLVNNTLKSAQLSPKCWRNCALSLPFRLDKVVTQKNVKIHPFILKRSPIMNFKKHLAKWKFSQYVPVYNTQFDTYSVVIWKMFAAQVMRKKSHNSLKAREQFLILFYFFEKITGYVFLPTKCHSFTSIRKWFFQFNELLPCGTFGYIYS